MRPVTRLLLFAFAAILIPVGLAVVFHDALARWITLRLVQQAPGIEVALDGPFKATNIAPLTLDASGVELAFNGEALNGTRSRFGTLHLEMRLWPLLRGIVYIERLIIADGDIEIPPASTPATPEQSATALRLPFIEEMRLERVHVRFQRKTDAERHELNVAHLQIGASESGVLKAKGTASLDGGALELTADFGSVEQLLRPTAPFPIDATLRSPDWGLEAGVTGTLDEPLRGRGMRLDVRAKASDIAPLREVLIPDAPFTGALDAKAHVSGDLDAPALSDVRVAVDDGDRLRLTLGGSIADVRKWENLDLQVDAASQDPAVVRFLTRDAVAAVQTMRLRAAVRGRADDYVIDDLEAEVSGKNDLSVGVRGSFHLAEVESGWSLEGAELNLHVSAAAADLDAWLPQAVPRTGTLQLKARVVDSADALVVSDLNLTLEKTRPVRGALRGALTYSATQIEALRSGREPSADVLMPAHADLTVDLVTDELQSLSSLLDYDLPDLGPVSAKARLRGDGKAIAISKLDVRTTGKRPLGLTATGHLTFTTIDSKQSIEDVDLRLTAKGQNVKSVASIVGPVPIDPGPWTLRAQIRGKTGALRAEAIEFTAGNYDSLRMQVEGNISDLERMIGSAGKSPSGVTLKGELTAASTEQFGPLVGGQIPDLGAVEVEFEARGHKGEWSIPKATADITHLGGFGLKVSGEANDLLRDPRFDTTFALHVPDPKGTAALSGASLPWLPAISADGHIQGSRKQARLKGRIDLGSTRLETDLDADLTGPRPHLSGTISTPLLQLSEFSSPEVAPNAASNRPADPGRVQPAHLAQQTRYFSDRPLGFEHLHHADIDLAIIADRIEGETIRTERLELTVDVDNGQLKVNHNTLKHEDGTISSLLEVDNAVDPPRVTFKGRANNIPLGALHAHIITKRRPLEGLLSFDVDVAGSGHSPHALLATANGRYGHILENANITGTDLDSLSLNMLRLLLTTVASRDHTTIDCSISKFRVQNGLATSETLFVHTPKMIAAGTGHLNFSDETVDIVVNAEAKRLLFGKKAVLRIHGPMRKLQIDTDLTGAAVSAGLRAAGAGTAMMVLPPLGFSMVGLGFLQEFVTDGKKQPCVSSEL